MVSGDKITLYHVGIGRPSDRERRIASRGESEKEIETFRPYEAGAVETV